MSKITAINNKIQEHILSQLVQQENIRFKDLQPPKTTSNVFSYHLKQLLANKWIVKTEEGYSLGPKGLAYAERHDDEQSPIRMQPSIAIALVVQDAEGRVLIQKRGTQPYINAWQLPSTRASVADTSITEAGKWAAKKILHYAPETLKHAGDCYVRIHSGKLALSSTLFHVIRFDVDDLKVRDGLEWAEPLDVMKLRTCPGTEQMMTRAFFNDEYFFEEYVLQANDQRPLGI